MLDYERMTDIEREAYDYAAAMLADHGVNYYVPPTQTRRNAQTTDKPKKKKGRKNDG